MCDKTATALKVLLAQPNRGGLSEAAAMVFEQVIEDTKKIEGRLSNLETDVGAIKQDVSLLVQRFSKPSWLSRFWEKHGDKLVLIMVLIVAAYLSHYALPELTAMWRALV